MLYNKYRPQTIDELWGNKHLKQVIKNLSPEIHTIILTGDSGTGKTTIARIIARQLLGDDTDFNLIEMDAASHNGVEEMRNLKTRLISKTFSGKPRIIYMDECHTLTKQAWQALLKITEEPGNNIFIFSTTEEIKIPKTIKTRNLNLKLESPSQTLLKKYTAHIFEQEEIKLYKDDEDTILGAIAYISDNYRSILVNIDNIILANKDKTKLKLEDITNVISEEEIKSLRSFPKLYANQNWKGIADLIKGIPDSAELANLAWYMFNLSKKKYYDTKTIKHSKFATLVGELLTSGMPINKTSLELAILKYLSENK